MLSQGSVARTHEPGWYKMTIYSFLTAISFSASSSAPTPVYALYKEAFQLTPLVITLVFSSYALSLLAALLTVGRLSDYVGRRPLILAALTLNVLGLVVFIVADSAAALVIARVVQGFATGIATATLGAAILDTDVDRGPLLNSLSAFLGLAIGSLGAGLLVSFAPAPTRLVYVLLLGVTAAEVGLLALMPETGVRKSGGLVALIPRIRVPDQIRADLAKVSPVNIAAWALGGYYQSLIPSVLMDVLNQNLPLVGGAIVSALMLAAAAAVFLLQRLPARRSVYVAALVLPIGIAITLSGIALQQVSLIFAGTIVSGSSFGASLSGILRVILPMAKSNERAGLLSAFYVESYLAYSLPAICLGLLAPVIGLKLTSYLFGAVLSALPLATLVALAWPERNRAR